MEKNYSTTIKFLGAVWEVTPSAEILTHKYRGKTIKTMIDAGITPGKKDHLIIPNGIDILFLSHGHADHVWAVPKFYIQNPDAKIFVPAWNRPIMAHNILEAYKRSLEEDPETKMKRWINEARWLLESVQANMISKGIKRGTRGNRRNISQTHQQRKAELTEHENNLEDALHRLCDFLNISERDMGDLENSKLITYLRNTITQRYNEWLDEIRSQWVITRRDVDRSISAIKELKLSSFHKIMDMGESRGIKVRFDPTGHLVTWPACSIGIDLPIPGWSSRKILFSGDIGNPELGYPWTDPDFSELYNGFDTLVLESTYGNRDHPDRASELRKLDAKIIQAVENKTDIAIITLALERPVFVLYEIIQCLQNHKIDPHSVDISYFWDSIGTLFTHFPKWEIRDTVRPFMKSFYAQWAKPNARKTHMAKLGQKWSKPRIIISSGGFFPEEGPSAGLMASMYPQEKLLIVSPNFHGEPGSNWYRLFHGQKYRIDGETYEPKSWHQLFYTWAFSGHGDRERLTRYARKTIRDDGKIFLNHWSDEARKSLAEKIKNDPVIRSKWAKVFLPQADREYKATQ